MKYYRKSVFRMALRSRGSVMGAVLIIGLGIFVLVSMMDTLWNLRSQILRFYREQGMADVFAEVSAISDAELERIKEIPGIAEASGKIGRDIRIYGKGMEGIVTVHLLSFDDAETLNQPILSRAFVSDTDLFLGKRMEEAYHYASGTELRLLVGGESRTFYMAGTVVQPDYIYSVPPGGSMIPDGRVYDIAMIRRSRLEALTGTRSLNELGFRLRPGYRFSDVRMQLTAALKPYGLSLLSERAEQTSCHMVEGEFQELIATGTVVPLIFMGISVFMLYVVLEKLIRQERCRIGTMKAFGMTDGELLSGYLLEGLLIGLSGAVLGGLLAGGFGRYMFALYCDYFNLPDTQYHDYLYSRLFGIGIAVFTATLAVLAGIREILCITPAMAMRPKSPDRIRELRLPDWAERRLSFLSRLAIRSMGRNLLRSVLIILAAAFPFAMASVLFSFRGIVRNMLSDEFNRTEIYDLQLELDHCTSPITLRNTGRELRGVSRSEAVFQAPVLLEKGAVSEYSVLTGLNAGEALWRILDRDGHFHAPPQDGVILNRKTADKLHVERGDEIYATLPGHSVRSRAVRVTDIVQEPLGDGEYVALPAFPEVLGIPPVANKLLLKAEKGELSLLRRETEKASRLRFLVDMQRAEGSYSSMMGSMYIMMDAFALMAFAAGAILILNISAISLRERMNEIVTLRIMGATRGEISRMLLLELIALTLAGILLGIPGNWGLRRLLETVMISDSYDIRLPMDGGACMAALLFCLLMALYAWHRETHLLDSMQLTDALKERE